MPVYPIPDDWDGETWTCILIEWPNSIDWLGILRGLVTTPLRGRFWDGLTGSIIDAQNIGLEIEERNPVSSCEDIVIALQGIQAAVEGLDVSSDLQVTIQTNIQNSIDLVAVALATSLADQTLQLVSASIATSKATASAFAWSRALSQNFVGVYIINNTEGAFRPIEPGVDEPPQAPEEAPTGISSTTESTVSVNICKRAYWAVANARTVFNFLHDSRSYLTGTVLSLGSALSDALSAAAWLDPSGTIRWLMPAAALVEMTHGMEQLMEDNLLSEALALLDEYFTDEFETIVCELAQDVESGVSTKDIQDRMWSEVTGFGAAPQVANLVLAFFNLSTLAALYYVSPLMDIAPNLPAGTPPTICTACGV